MIELSTETWATIGTLLGVAATLLIAMTTMFHQLRVELKGDIAGIRVEFKEEIASLRVELKGDLADLRTEFKDDIADLRTEFKGEMAHLRADVKGDVAGLGLDLRRLDERVYDISRRLPDTIEQPRT